MSGELSAGMAAALAVVALAAAWTTVGAVVEGARIRRRVRDHVSGPSGRPIDSRSSRLRQVASDPRALLLGVVDRVDGGARARRRADRSLPGLLDQVTRQLRSGASLPTAVGVAAADDPEPATARLAEELAAGESLARSVDGWGRARPTPSRSLAAAALVLASEAGGSVASVLDGVTDTLRDRVALDREVAALSSQARASAAVLVVAPVAFALLAAGADRRVGQVLLGSPVGWGCLAAGAVLDGLGALWMARLIGRSR